MAATGDSAGYIQQTSTQTGGNSIRTSRDKDGNTVTEASGTPEGGIPLRAHDFANEDEINLKLFGKGATNVQRQNSKFINADGDTVEESNDSNMRVGVHDQTTEDEEAETNRRLWGVSTTASLPKTNEFTDREGNTVMVAADDNTGIRTHDFSDQDEINRKLFGQGAKKGANEQVC